jgi:hypothetical protein
VKFIQKKFFVVPDWRNHALGINTAFGAVFLVVEISIAKYMFLRSEL